MLETTSVLTYISNLERNHIILQYSINISCHIPG